MYGVIKQCLGGHRDVAIAKLLSDSTRRRFCCDVRSFSMKGGKQFFDLRWYNSLSGMVAWKIPIADENIFATK